MEYTFHADPGHAWLAVPTAELFALGIASEISGHSYVKGKTAYLEEDCDAGRFIKAWEIKNGQKMKFKETHTNDESPIRGYRSACFLQI